MLRQRQGMGMVGMLDQDDVQPQKIVPGTVAVRRDQRGQNGQGIDQIGLGQDQPAQGFTGRRRLGVFFQP